MCEFISWITLQRGGKEQVLFVTDADLKHLPSRVDNDPLGHGAIRALYDIDSGVGVEYECTQFWKPELFPAPIAELLATPEGIVKTWGTMIGVHMDSNDIGTVMHDGSAPEWAKDLVINRLKRAAKSGHIKQIKYVLWYGNNLSQDDRTPLIQMVVDSGSVGIARYVLERDKNLSQDDRTPLIQMVVDSGDVDNAGYVLAYGKNLSQDDRTPLIKMVVDSGSVGDAKCVLRCGNNLSQDDRTALIKMVVDSGDVGYAKDMLQYGKNLSQDDRTALQNIVS